MKDTYFFRTLFAYAKRLKAKENIKSDVQCLYNQFGYGYDQEHDYQLLEALQRYNENFNVPFLATGQNGYFNEQVDLYGLSSLKVNNSDVQDAKFISACFGKNKVYQENEVSVLYTTLLGTTEFNYAAQTFPAGIFEDVFQCSPNHELPINPLVGEDERDFYLRLLKHQISISDVFDKKYESEVLIRAKNLIENFCKYKNRVYLISIEDALRLKASFGDVDGLREGAITREAASQKLATLPSLKELIDDFAINMKMPYAEANLTSEYGIALYGEIPKNKLKYIEVERKYQMMQKKAIDLGYNIGDEITPDLYYVESTELNKER